MCEMREVRSSMKKPLFCFSRQKKNYITSKIPLVSQGVAFYTKVAYSHLAGLTKWRGTRPSSEQTSERCMRVLVWIKVAFDYGNLFWTESHYTQTITTFCCIFANESWNATISTRCISEWSFTHRFFNRIEQKSEKKATYMKETSKQLNNAF